MHDSHANEEHLELVWKRKKGADGRKRLVAQWVVVHPGAPASKHYAA